MSFNSKERDGELSWIIIEAFGYIERYLDGVDEALFLIDRKTQDAVSMRLQQILECASKFSEESKSKLKIDWISLTAMRHKVSHHYVDVDPKVIWQVINNFSEFKKLINWTKKNT